MATEIVENPAEQKFGIFRRKEPGSDGYRKQLTAVLWGYQFDEHG